MGNNQLTRLENFIFGHKSRYCQIGIDDGYGATCWSVDITTEKGSVSAHDMENRDKDLTLEEVIKLAIDRAEEKVEKK